MTNWDIYTRRININGDSLKEIKINSIKNSILNNFVDIPSFFQVKINNIDREVNIVEENSTVKNPNKKRLLCKPDETINIGDLVEFDNSNWICINNDTNSEIYDVGIIERCNNIIQFYNQNHILSQIPCIVSKSLSLNTEENKFLTTVDNEFYLTVSNNLTTQQIRVNDVYKIGVNSYEISSIPDDISSVGLLIFKVKYSEQPQETHNYQLIILNDDNIQIAQSQSLTINCQLTDNGVEVPSPPLLFSSDNENVATIDSNGVVNVVGLGTVKFTVSMVGNDLVSDNIVVEIVADEQNNYTYELLGVSDIIKGQSQTYQANKYNNGILVPDTNFTFEIIPGSTPISAYTLSIVDNDQCSIIASSVVYYIVLRAVDDSNGEYVEKQIRLKNIF